MIQIQTVELQRGAKFLLENASLTINPGQKVGLIGANGSGKSSLFKLLLGELHEDAGHVSVPAQWSVAHMAQEVGESRRSAIDHVMDGDLELRAIQTKIESASEGALAGLYEQLERIDGYTAQARAQKLLNGLGFQSGDDVRPCSEFSGGWRIRLNLAQALMCRSDLLLLDEPTNHLDLDACVWLEQWLQNYAGTLLIISHDRDFLDNVVRTIVHLDQQALTSYTGNYSSFEIQRAERLSQQAQAFEKQQQRVSEIENFVRRFRAKATKAKQAQSRLKELERMEKIAPAHIDSPFSFRFPEPEKQPQTLITLSEAHIGYEQAIVENVEWSVLGTTRVGLLGHNGAGKSTLMKTLANARGLLSGSKVESPQLRIGYYSQHQLDTLDFAASPALHLQRLDASATEQKIRTFLGSFGFQGDRAFETIEHFSGGEKARLALAILAWQKPNLLLLDEPTNHLDLEVRHALTLALQAFDGAIVVVSHDRHLLKNTVDQFMLVDEGQMQLFDGDLSDYEAWLQRNRESENTDRASANDSAADKKQKRQHAAAARAKLKPITSAIKKIERKMDSVQVELSDLEAQLADPDIYNEENKVGLSELLKNQSAVRAQLDELEADWLEQNELLEAAQAD